MFKAVIKAETLKSVIYIINTIVDEVKMTVTPEKVSMKAIDPAHVAMIDIAIKAEAFLTYESEATEIGLDLEKLKSVLKLADSSSDVCLEYDSEQGRLTIRIGNITRRMSVVDTSSMIDPKVPALEMPNHIEIAAEALKMGIKASDGIADHIAISADTEGFEISCEGDTDSASLRVSSKDTLKTEIQGSVKSMYPVDYFSNIVKVIPDKTAVDVHLDNDFPIKLLFGLADGMINVVYFLAPRIENE